MVAGEAVLSGSITQLERAMKRRSHVALVIAALVSVVSLPAGVLAQSANAPVVTMTITGGLFTYALSGGTIERISFDHTRSENVTTVGSVGLTVDDARGTHEGWSVDIASTAFVYAGDASGNNDILAGNATVIPTPPKLVAGFGLDGVRAGATGTLDGNRTVLSADPGTGSGKFFQELVIYLDIPALSPAGTYTALLTISTTAAPE